MATIAMATADLRDLSIFHFINGTISSTQARTGTYSYRLDNQGDNWQLKIPGRSEVYLRVAVYRGTEEFRIRIGSVTQCTVTFISGTITVNYLVTGTLLGSVTVPFTANVWNVYEIYIKSHLTDGIVTIKENGTQILNVTGRTNEAAVLLDLVVGQTASYGLVYCDDIVIDDAAWPGLGGIEVLLPNGDGTDVAWTGSYLDVDDNPPNDDTDYVSANATINAKQSFTFPAPAGIPVRAGLFTKSKLDGAGSGTLRPYMGISPGAELILSTSYQWSKDFWDAPTLADAGVEVIV